MEDFDIVPIYIRNTNSHMLKISPVTEDTVIQALQILLDQSRYPILVTCEHGRTLTGAVIGCLRKLQRWSMISIFDEYRRYARTRLEQQHEQFIE
jgi:tyrosine-protein phosphatase OCA1